jgi:hypothetical protein
VAEKNLVRWNEDSPGSLIWTTSKQNQQLVTDNAFWEIRNGKTTLFSQDSLQQWPILSKEDWAPTICNPATRARLTKVADYWRDNPLGDTWRQWYLDRYNIDMEAGLDLTLWQEEMAKRKIPSIAGEDILIWGYRPQGTFNTRESYELKAPLDPLPNKKPWCKLWSLKHWPKITLFLWLMNHSSILTWDNLVRRGFAGPSICLLCGEAEETMNHLLNSCHYTTQIWDQVVLIMRTSDRCRDSILTTITEWRDQDFQSPLLNRVWQLLPGFILWKTWKERN